MESITRPDGGVVRYNYNPFDNLLSLTDPLGRVTRWEYDALNRPVKEIDPLGRETTRAYDAAGRLDFSTNRRGQVLDYGYDAAGRLTALNLAGQDLINWSYDTVGRMTEARDSDSVVTRAYDVMNRIVSETQPTGTQAYAYDLGGRRRGRRPVRINFRPARGSPATAGYDADGNLIERRSKSDATDVRTLTWDPLNRLTSVQTPTVSVQYRYDAFGRRIARSVTTASSTTEVRYLFDGDNVRAEQDATGTWTAANVHAGLDQMLLRDDFAVGQSYYLHADALGSTLALSDANGAVVETYRYSAYGQVVIYDASLNPQPSTLNPLCPYLYTGRDYEPEIGFYNYRARAYDPGLGRFISRDPLGFAAGDMNLYAYVLSNPFNYTDPYGLVNWGQVGQGAVTTIVGIGTMVGGATLAGATAPTVGGAVVGVVAMISGATSTGLGLATMAQGFADSGPVDTPTGTIPQGPAELTGAMTGSFNSQVIGGYADTAISFATPPSWGGGISFLNSIQNYTPLDPSEWPINSNQIGDEKMEPSQK